MAGGSAVISCRNAFDGETYNASLIWRRRAISAEEPALNGGFELAEHVVFGEAWIWRGGWLNLLLRPVLVLGYRPTEPTDPRLQVFRALVQAIVEECELARIAEGDTSGPLYALCEPYRIWPIFGYRRHRWTRRRLPHLLLFGWPEGRPYPVAPSR